MTSFTFSYGGIDMTHMGVHGREVELSNSGKKSFDSIRQSDKFAARTLIFK